VAWYEGRRQGHRSGLRRTLRPVLLALAVVVVSGCDVVKPGISAKSDHTHWLWSYIFWLALPVFLFVEGMLVIGVIRFRQRRSDDESEPVQDYGNKTALVAFFAAPLALIIALLAVGEKTVASIDHHESHVAEHLVVTGSQWQWSARYVQEGLTVSGVTATAKSPGKPMTMALPAGKTSEITLMSNDVIHGFYVQRLLFQKNAVPGHPNVFTITPTKTGTFHGQCTQFCGLWHSRMTILLKVLPPAEFQAWMTQQQQAQSTKGGTCAPTGSSVTLVAHNIQWNTKCIAALAGKPFTVTVTNQDAPSIAHNFAIWQSPALKHRLYLTPDVTSQAAQTFTAPALPPGKYYFQCDIHGPAMSGTLVIGNPQR
jgi:cytochrome c oxidase subunit 2